MKERTGSKVISRVRERECLRVERRLKELRQESTRIVYQDPEPLCQLILESAPERPSLAKRIWRAMVHSID